GSLSAVPAAALMLGAAHGASTVGLNFQDYYYTDGGGGYQTTGMQVTAKAFGVAASDWTSTPPLSCGWGSNPDPNTVPISTNVLFGGTLTAQVDAPDAWQSGIGMQTAEWVPVTVVPGNDEVTWGYISSGYGNNGADGAAPTVTVSGLAAKFPNGYVVQTIAAHVGSVTYNDVDFTDGTTSSTSAYSTYYVKGPVADGYGYGSGTVGLSAPSSVFNRDTFHINPQLQTAGNRSLLAGFIITDKPVVSLDPASGVYVQGTPFGLTAGAIGIPGLSYQWRTNGVNIPGATSATYTNTSATAADAGNYDVVVTNIYGATTSGVATVTIVVSHPAQTVTWDADPATAGPQDGNGIWNFTPPHWWNGASDSTWWLNDTAVFGAGGTSSYTVTLGDSMSADAITFSSGNYTLTNTSGQTITLLGTAGIAANTNAVIGAPLSTGTNTFFKTGAGTLSFSGALACAGTVVRAGTLEVLAKSGDSPYVVTNGATLKIGYSTGGGYANTAMTIYGDGVAATSGLYLMGGKTYNVSGGVVINSAPTTIRHYGTGMAGIGMFDINGAPGLSFSAAASGSVLDSNIQMVSSGYGMVLTTAPGAKTTTGDLIINGPLNVGSLGFLKEGTGSIRLNAVAAPGNLALNVMNGTVICGTNNCVGANAILNLGAVKVSGVVPKATTVLDLNGFSQTVTNASLAGNIKMTINKGGTPNSSVLTVTDVATFLNYGGTLTVTNIGGTLVIGDTFTLFRNLAGTGFNGAFINLNLPPLGDGQGWQDNTAVDGTIKVVVGSVPPSIVTDLPTDPSSVYVGGSFSFSVVATGDPLLHYQWKRGTTTVGTDSPKLTLSSVTTADTGDYSVIVSNHYGTAPSATNHLTVLVPTNYPAIVMAGSPTAYWPLDEQSGPTMFDYVNGHNGTYLNAVTLGIQGAIPGETGTAMTASTGNNYASVPYTPALNPAGPFTVVAWFNPSGPADAGFFVCPLASADLSSNRSGWLIYQSPSGWNFRTYMNNGATAGVNITGTTAPVVGAWTQVICVWDGTKGYLYENGVRTATSGATTYVPNSTAPFTIGARSDGAYYLNGNSTDDVSIDEVQFYNRALSPQEIQSLGLNRPLVKIATSGNSLVLTWPTGTLQAAPEATGTYTNVPSATSPWPVSPTDAKTFYRLMQ
ncbi:MAG: hypothetical protein NT154_26955, partial [Verrucomicrobia bacterium]|nr:hypothetical protein [Verrucomicrobiota bacterium]